MLMRNVGYVNGKVLSETERVLVRIGVSSKRAIY